MALIIRGQSRCLLCGQILEADDELLSFPAFIVNDRDRLAKFNDAAIHGRCLLTCVDAQEAQRWANIFLDISRPAWRQCQACGEVIEDWRDHLGLGLITSDSKSPLKGLNFVQLHRSHVHEWPAAERTLRLLKDARLRHVVGGRGIDQLIDELSSLAWS